MAYILDLISARRLLSVDWEGVGDAFVRYIEVNVINIAVELEAG